VRLTHPANACASILCIFSGIVICFKPVHPANEYLVHCSQTLSQDNLFQIVTSPENIGIQTLDRFRNYNELYLLIVLKGTLAYDFHCIRNRDAFFRASVFYQCTPLRLKIKKADAAASASDTGRCVRINAVTASAMTAIHFL